MKFHPIKLFVEKYEKSFEKDSFKSHAWMQIQVCIVLLYGPIAVYFSQSVLLPNYVKATHRKVILVSRSNHWIQIIACLVR